MKKAFTLTFLISELNSIQKISLKVFLIGATILTFSLLNKEATAQVSGTVFNDFNYNATKDAISASKDESSVMKTETLPNFWALTIDKSNIIPDQNNDAIYLAKSDALALGVIMDNSGFSGNNKHSFDIGLT